MKINRCCFNLSGVEKKACWEIESRCNLNCPFCFHANQSPLFSSINGLNISPIIQQLQNRHIQHVILSGGEPLLCDSFFHIIKELESNDITVSICTNAILAGEAFCKQLIETSVRKVTVNIADLSYLKKTPCSEMDNLCLQIISGIRRLIKYGFDVTLNDIIFEIDREQFERRLIFCQENGAQKVSFTIPVCKHMTCKQTTLSETQINKAIDLLQSLEKQFPGIEIIFNSPDCQSSDCPSQQMIFGIEGLEFLPSCLVKRDLEGITS